MARRGNYFKFYFGKVIFYSQITVIQHYMLIHASWLMPAAGVYKLLLIIVTPQLKLFQEYIEVLIEMYIKKFKDNISLRWFKHSLASCCAIWVSFLSFFISICWSWLDLREILTQERNHSLLNLRVLHVIYSHQMKKSVCVIYKNLTFVKQIILESCLF